MAGERENITHDIIRKRFRGQCYCCFCKKTVEPNVVPLAQGGRRGRYKTIRAHLYLCPICGGNVWVGAKRQEKSVTVPGIVHRGKAGKYHW